MQTKKELQKQWLHDSNNWKFGIFYYNKADNRWFPPKKIPWMGWTINFAKPKSILAFLLLFGFFLVVIHI